MHDVTRELCLREARNVNFVNVLRGTSNQNPCTQFIQCFCTSRGRISIHNEEELVRYRNSEPHSINMFGKYQCFEPELPFKLVRVLDLASICCPTFPSGILSLTHLRYLALTFNRVEKYLGSEEEVPSSIIEIPPLISSLCNMETFILDFSHSSAKAALILLPSEILMMPQLRHLRLTWNYLHYHGITGKSLELQIRGFFEDFCSCKDLHDLRYLDQLEELENLAFTGNFFLPLKDLSIVGKLPKLKSLKLEDDAFIGDEWEVVEEGFPLLKFLLLKRLNSRHWRASSDHFPCLERLILDGCWNLDSIPQEFADITTRSLIDINICAQSVGNSATQIQQDIEDNYGGSIEVHIRDTLTIHQSMQLSGRDLQPFYEKLKSLRAILEKPWKATDDLEALTRLEAEIAEEAYSAEDMVDSKSRNVLLAQKAKNIESRAFWELCCSLEQEVERIDSLMMQWLAIWNWYSKIKDLKARKFSLAASIPAHAVEKPENIMVGHENEFEMMLNQVAGGERELEVVSIVGMGGIGKTTLATKLYSDPRIMSHFNFLAKTTLSQEYCVRNVLLDLLGSKSEEPDDQLADQLQKLLKGKRYLAVIDDIWTTGAWDDIRQCFPDCNNRSRILLTTRNVEVAGYASSGKPPYHMRLMDFDENSFPSEFEQLGKQIALKCGGLPLAIIVIAGLLSKIGKTLDEWQSIAGNVEEMENIEEVAENCLTDLADRSLISITHSIFDGKKESCGMHDVTRELCLREARNVNFVTVLRGTSDQNPCTQSMQTSRGRISFHDKQKLVRYRNCFLYLCFQTIYF
ncbi:hypothetical protein H5410_059304 [Solanum commersonii]|uniref:NB-ARC domain-containing protein n=1 Tax=Solanum commersonii TaxID=4109 RepID=A0A9J5W259_SOLCO|nr:hypothetical protein H5410_059304 [Solanum commersonii]